MADLKVEYEGVFGVMEEVRDGGMTRVLRKRRRRSLTRRAGTAIALTVFFATLPFAVLIRGGVFAYREWALGAWPSLFLAVLATALLLLLYAWALGRKLNAGKSLRWVMTRAAVAYAAYGLVYIGSANVKSEEVRAEYARIHPLLPIASSALVLIDPSSVLTDAGRTSEDYFAMGLPVNEASLHFEQDDGFVHALDIRTARRPSGGIDWSRSFSGCLGFIRCAT
ncbi:MAG: hypothetical protein O2992_09390 [Gemmatimonadetes bacterium]|nr:hypothetical protein [Gemmatimonadota bacterium]